VNRRIVSSRNAILRANLCLFFNSFQILNLLTQFVKSILDNHHLLCLQRSLVFRKPKASTTQRLIKEQHHSS